jgi:hypothetical protein
MENQTNSSQNCGCTCGDSCCPPEKKKSNLWKKLVFVIIILAAGAIITVKLVSKPAKCCDKTENATFCPQSKTEKQ